jgi:hypothetical protein
MMEAASASETWENVYQTSWRNNPNAAIFVVLVVLHSSVDEGIHWTLIKTASTELHLATSKMRVRKPVL